VERGEADTTADRKAVIQRSRELLAEANQAYVHGQPDTALARLEVVIAADSENPDAYYFIGIIKLSLADTSGAEAALAQGAQLAPLSRRIKLMLARVWIEAGKIDEAEGILAEVMVLRPKDIDCLYLSGLIALARADTSGAVKTWDAALSEKLGGEQ
jgi:cytochrome c-type biogenesis protein CcmH/NrfG